MTRTHAAMVTIESRNKNSNSFTDTKAYTALHNNLRNQDDVMEMKEGKKCYRISSMHTHTHTPGTLRTVNAI